jgi:two-component system, OmpR family, sensor histidine kinase QseC
MTGWPKALRVFFTEPSLVRRGVGSVLLAFFLVWAVLSCYILYNVKQSIANDSGLRKFGNALAISLADIQDRDTAGSFIASTAIWVNIRRKEIGLLPGSMQFELLEKNGQRVYATPELGGQLIVGESGKLIEQHLLEKTHRIFQVDTTRWQLRIAEPIRSDGDILRYNSRALVPYLLLAMPIVLLAVWLSVRHGLSPLQQLAQRISTRGANELSPINFVAKHQELKPLMHSLDAMLAQLRQKVAREHAFVQDAAHELRTPMAVITAQAHVMAHTQSAPERSLAQQHLDQAIARASHLAQQLLDLAALDDARRPPPRTLDVAQCLRQLLAQAAPGAIARHIELSLEAPDSMMHTVEVPALESVVQNLLDNALRYVPEGGMVAVTLRSEAEGLSLSVQDDGPGIAPDEQARVFERFYRGTGHEVTGSGLGLAIVQQAVFRLGGTVRIGPGLAGRGVGFVVQLF